jgi:hypothetical protein
MKWVEVLAADTAGIAGDIIEDTIEDVAVLCVLSGKWRKPLRELDGE